MGSGKGFGWAGVSNSYVSGVRTSIKLPHFCLQEKTHPDRGTDQYMTVLDGFRGPDSAVRTYAGGLWVLLGDALMGAQGADEEGIPHKVVIPCFSYLLGSNPFYGLQPQDCVLERVWA